MKNPPAFQFYPGDFVTDANVATMTLSEVGAYTLLLCHCWIEGDLPDDDKFLGKLVNDPKHWGRLRAKVVPCFSSYVGKDGTRRLYHKRLRRERKKQLAYAKTRSENVKKRYEKKPTHVEHMIPSSTTTPSSSLNTTSTSSLKKDSGEQSARMIFVQNFIEPGRHASPIQLYKVDELVTRYGEFSVLQALTIAAQAGKKDLRYVEGILKNTPRPRQTQKPAPPIPIPLDLEKKKQELQKMRNSLEKEGMFTGKESDQELRSKWNNHVVMKTKARLREITTAKTL